MATRNNPVSESRPQDSVAPDNIQTTEQGPQERPTTPPPAYTVASTVVPARTTAHAASRGRSRSLPRSNRPAQRVLFHEPAEEFEPVPGPSSRPDPIFVPRVPTPPATATRARTVPPPPEGTALQAPPSGAAMTDWRALIRALRTPDVPHPTFAGLDHEDPDTFLSQCEHFFTEAAIEPSLWSRMVAKSLTDKAAKWYELYRNLSLPWAKFRALLKQHFAGVSALNKLHVKLYANKQEEKEAVGVFLQRKYLLALRLLPTTPEAQIVSLLLETIKPSIKKVLRAATIDSFEDLVERAVQAETDEAEETLRKPATAHNKSPINTQQPTARESTTAPRPPPQCHYCPGRHFHRDCPILKTRQPDAIPGNWRARAAEANVSAAPVEAATPPS